MATKEIVSNMWSRLVGAKKGESVTERAIVEVLDFVLESTASTSLFDGVILANNAAAVHRNEHGDYATQALYNIVKPVTTNLGSTLSNWEKILAEPNIAGVPISASRVSSNREIEVSESMVIVQESAVKKYWTDNAVPRLKEWTIEGYLTSASSLDIGCVIKPSLTWQAYYLDVCAKSRRPVIFKTHRGEFVKVQITNLNTEEDPSYNNVIKVSISVKEYNPLLIKSDPGSSLLAVMVGRN